MKRILLLSLTFIFLLLLIGCKEDKGSLKADVSGEKIILTDKTGEKTELTKAAARVISLSPSNTEILFAVGGGELAVGVTEFCNYPEEALALEKVGGFAAKTINLEKIVALDPHLVLAGPNHKELAATLRGLNINVITLASETFEDIFYNIELTGKAIGKEKEAGALVAGQREIVAMIISRTKKLTDEQKLRVFWEVWDEPLMTAGPQTFIGQMIEIAGGKNIFADVKERYPQVSSEEIIMRNPQVILSPDSHSDKVNPEELAKRAGWSSIDAVKDKRVYLIGGDISSRPGPRLVDALEDIFEQLYPEL